MAEYFGVRHLSPSCGFYVEQFLDKTKPDVVLIEGPADLNELISPLCSVRADMPAAILAYTTEAPVRTVMYPLAEFSPEYRAMLWADRNNIPVKFCDLPSGCVLADDNDDDEYQDGKSKGESVYEKLEKISGLDNDTFWEYNFEHCQDYSDFISAVEEYGKSLRELSESDSYNELREAFMRRTIHEAEQEYNQVAVITGAFHTYGLKDKTFTKSDEKLIKKLKTVDTKATLMPYSYYRLSSRSGYGAGSKAPAYYEILWKNRVNGTLADAKTEYLSRIASYQRENGFSASSAEVIESVRLAETLCAMRGGNMPSMADLRDSAVTCMGHGSFGEISLACADVEIGTKIGTLPDGTVCTSVQEDFTRQLKELKLDRFRKVTGEELELDLRENLRVKSEKSAFLDLNRSFFLHRLRVCGINFGEKTHRQQENATWAEKWVLSWTPETEIQIVEASLNGDTVEAVADYVLNSRLLMAEKLSDTAQVLSEAFECGLADCLKTAVKAVQRLAVDCASAVDSAKTISTLSGIVRFGNIRRIDTEPLVPLIQQLFLRFCLQADSASICDSSAGNELVTAIAGVNDACLAHDFLETEKFTALLDELADNDRVNPLVSGFACAVLIERGRIGSEKLSELISRRMSKGNPPTEGALWFEGLSKRNRRSLISRISVWEKLAEFIAELDDDEFKPVLICLRRTFGDFSPSEKSDIAENIGEVLGISAEQASEFVMADMTEEEQEAVDSLDDFDFGDI
ncbi:MAG: DUF5682 family protein [Ruminococcus flavefaciens]|nr:DUF5682 family protein [Ruminococcus flavefaciens]MCM1230514.1 DUF5682 family protein [Ruminococcus flavefaciens]